MASLIKVRTISAVTETAIQLANSCFARSINIGTSWNTIRLGMRLHMDNLGGAISGTPRFAFGFCHGTTNIFGDATTDHFVGAVSTAASWSFQTTFFNTTSFAPATRVGSSLTTGTALIANGAVACGSGSNTADRQLLFVDLIKGSPNFTLKLFIANNTVGTDASSNDFLTQMEAATPAFGSNTYTAGQTIAVDESGNGFLDAINISWDRTSPVIEICDLAVARLA